MTQDTKLQQLVINKLTTAQYQAALNAGTIDPNQLYMTTDSQTLRDVTVGGSSIVSNNTAALGTMALETASNYSTKAVADTLYAQKALETTVAGKLDKISTASKVYGTDVNGNQTSYDITSFGNVDDVKVGTTSVVANKIATLGTMAGQPTTNYYTKTEIDGKLSAGMHYKGTVASYSNLPSSDNQIGDLYNVTDTGSNYAWDGTAWDKLSENIDLSGVVPNTRTINGKELSTNITLSASDVGALPSSTVIPTVDQTYNASSSNAQSGVAINGAGFIRNTATGTNALTILGTPTNSFIALNIGFNSSASGSGATALGSYAIATGDANTFPLAVGYHAYAKANGAIQIGTGENNTARTLQIGFYINNTEVPYQWTLLDGATGLIPDARISTNIARTSQIPTIATTSVAGLVKPDGTTITIDANGVISSAASVEIDNETITKNGDNELQTVAIVNPNTNSGAISPLKIWQGTNSEYLNYLPVSWNSYKSETSVVLSSNSLYFSEKYSNPHRTAYIKNNSTYVIINDNKIHYSNDNGASWNSVTSPASFMGGYSTCMGAYGNNTYVFLTELGTSIYSTDNCQTWSYVRISTPWSLSSAGGKVIFTGTKFIGISGISTNGNNLWYSTDGITWTNGPELPNRSTIYWDQICYGNNCIIVSSQNNNNICYSIDDGVTWNTTTIGSSGGRIIMYGNNKFVAISNWSGASYYSTDGINWTTGGRVSGVSSLYISYTDGIFLVTSYRDDTASWSKNYGITWNKINLTSLSSSKYDIARAAIPVYKKFIIFNDYSSGTYDEILTIDSNQAYLLDSEPTLNSVVYSSPEVQSNLHINTVNENNIILSDNLQYFRDSITDVTTYRDIGTVQPDWLCNINNVGVKIGNTTIATAGGGSGIEEITDSEIEELWEQ